MIPIKNAVEWYMTRRCPPSISRTGYRNVLWTIPAVYFAQTWRGHWSRMSASWQKKLRWNGFCGLFYWLGKNQVHEIIVPQWWAIYGSIAFFMAIILIPISFPMVEWFDFQPWKWVKKSKFLKRNKSRTKKNFEIRVSEKVLEFDLVCPILVIGKSGTWPLTRLAKVYWIFSEVVS